MGSGEWPPRGPNFFCVKPVPKCFCGGSHILESVCAVRNQKWTKRAAQILLRLTVFFWVNVANFGREFEARFVQEIGHNRPYGFWKTSLLRDPLKKLIPLEKVGDWGAIRQTPYWAPWNVCLRTFQGAPIKGSGNLTRQVLKKGTTLGAFESVFFVEMCSYSTRAPWLLQFFIHESITGIT